MEDEVIADIARRVQKTGRYTETAELMAKSMVEQGYSAEKIQADVMKFMRADKQLQMEIAENTKAHKQEIQDIIEKTVKKAKAEGDKLVSEAGNMAWNNDLSMWQEQGVDLNKTNTMSQLIASFQAQTARELRNLTRSTGFRNTLLGTTGVMNAYQKEMDLALLKVASGTFSYDVAVNECVHRLAQSGLRSIDYASGKTYQIDTAVRMSVRTGMSQLAGKIMEENLKSTGQDLVITSQHVGSRPEHVPWQNKVFSYSGKSKKYPDFVSGTGYGSAAGLKGVNCTHDFYPFFEGSSVIPDDIEEPAPVTVNGKEYTYYQATQKQRQMERSIRATKREIEAQKAIGGNTDDLRASLRRQRGEYYKFSADVNIRPKDNRLRVISGTSDLKKNGQDGTQKKSGIADIKFKTQRSSSEVKNARTTAIKSYNALTSKTQHKMSDVTFKLGYNGSRCDYENGIIYASLNAEKEEIDHEFGHLIEYRMMSKKDVDEYKKYLVEDVSPIDVYPEKYYNSSGDEIEVMIVHGSRFVSEYQGRIYVDKMEDAFNSDYSIKTELMLETISEAFRLYQNKRAELSGNDKIVELIERAIT